MAPPIKAQKIITDNVSSKTGLRTTATEAINCRSYTDKIVPSVSLVSLIEKGDTTLCIKMSLVGSKIMSVKKDDEMTIRLNDGSVIELCAMGDEDDDLGKIDRVSRNIVRQFYINPMYKISKEQLEKIMGVGVKELRIELSPEDFAKEFSKDKLGSAIKKLYPTLEKAIKTPK